MSCKRLLTGQAYARTTGADIIGTGHALAWIHVLSRATVVLVALCSCLPAVLGSRDLQEASGEQSNNFRYVSTANAFVSAVADGVKHVVVTKHLDLTGLSRQLGTLTAGVVETDATATIQGWCESATPAETEQPLPSPRACILDVREDFLEASSATSALLLAHLYVRLRPTGNRGTATLILNKARSLWMSHVALQGNSLAVRGMDVYENSRVYIADSSMHGFARSFGSAIKLRGNVTAALERVSFANNSIIVEPNRTQRYGPDLYVGYNSTAVLRLVKTTVLPPPSAYPPVATPLPPPPPGAPTSFPQAAPQGGVAIAKQSDFSTVLADSDNITVYDVNADAVVPTELEIGTPDSVLTMDDVWYTNIIAEWNQLLANNPRIMDSGGDAGSEDDYVDVEDGGGGGGDVSAGPSLLDSASSRKDIDHDDDGMPSLVVIMVALAVGAALVIGLGVLAFWVYRKVQTKKQQELAVKRRRERRRSDGATEMTGSVGSMAFTSGPLQQTPSQASTTHTRSKSFGVFTSAQGVPGVPQQPDSARNERSTGFTRTGSLQSLPSCTTTIPVPAMILTNQRMVPGHAAETAAAPTTPASRSSPIRRPGTASSALTPIPGGSPHGASPKAHNIRSASTSSSSISNSIQLHTPSAAAAAAARSDGPVRAASAVTLRRTSEAAGSAAATESSSAPFGDAELAAALDLVASGGPQVVGWLCEGRYMPLGPDQRRVSGSGIVQFCIAHPSGMHVALKFLARRAAFLRTEALYKHSSLREFMPHILAIEAHPHDDDSTEQSAAMADSGEYTFPPCIVMERGECLRDWAVLRRPDFEQRLQVLAVVAERVSAIHGAGFGHRNLKPENILFRPSDQTWRLIDFANAARLGTRASLPKSLLYAPPEWVHATEAHSTMVPADPAADIWAFGVTTYELITGHPMFPPNASAADVRDALAGRAPLPWEHPSAIGDMGPGVFREFGALRRTLRSCLSRKASHRPNAEALVQELYGKLSALRRSGSSSPSRSRSSQR